LGRHPALPWWVGFIAVLSPAWVIGEGLGAFDEPSPEETSATARTAARAIAAEQENNARNSQNAGQSIPNIYSPASRRFDDMNDLVTYLGECVGPAAGMGNILHTTGDSQR
jgi:hypothetical protein